MNNKIIATPSRTKEILDMICSQKRITDRTF